MGIKISIVTICYNAFYSLERTILSVLNQTCSNVEYIIIDGGSTDGTVDIIKKYGTRLAYWVSEPDNGIYDAMNKGIKKASGEWVNFMNAGDCFASNDVIENVCKVTYTDNILVLYGAFRKVKCSFVSDIILPYDISCLSYKMSFCHQATFVRRSILEEQEFDSSYKIAADFKLFNLVYRKFGAIAFFDLDLCVALFDMQDSISNKQVSLLRHEYIKIRGIGGCILWLGNKIVELVRTYLKMK